MTDVPIGIWLKAGLVGAGAMVSVGPPLFSSCPSSAFTDGMLWLAEDRPQEPSGSML